MIAVFRELLSVIV